MSKDQNAPGPDSVQRQAARAVADLRAITGGDQPGGAVRETCAAAVHTIEAAQARITELEESLQALQELVAHATRFKIGTLFVLSRGSTGWAVSNSGDGSGEVFARDGGWEWEPQPSSRTDDFIARTRFTLEEAVHHAREQSEVLRIAQEAWLDAREARRAARAAAEASAVQ